MQHIVFRLANGKTVAIRAADGKYLQLVSSASTVPQLVWVSNPTLTGSGTVGSALTIGAGVYTNLERIQRDLLRDDVVILSNVTDGQTYTPTADDDGHGLRVREIAEGGTLVLTSYSTTKTITFGAPALSVIPNLGPYTQNTGNYAVDLSVYASGADLVWSLTGSSTASLDAETGLMSIPTVTLQAGVSATVTITNSGGSAQRTFTITVAEAAPTVDASVTWLPLSYGQSTGTQTFNASNGFLGANRVYSLISPPAGVTINSSTGVISTTTGSLLSATSVTVRATNGGGYAERTISVAVVTVVGTAPTLSGTAIPDRLGLIRGTTATTQTTAFAFSGTVTSYAVIGTYPGISINASTGVLTFTKAATFAQQTVTVRASNSAGSIDATFQASCIMQVLTAADVAISWRTDKTGESSSGENIVAGFFTWHFDLTESALPEPITALWWRPDAHVAGQGPGTGYHPCVRLNPQPSGLAAGVARWVARRCTPGTGAPMLKDWLDVVRTGVVGASRTHNLIWSASSTSLSPLTGMEFSGPVAADIVQQIALTGAPAISAAPTLSVASGALGDIGKEITAAEGTVTGDPVPTVTRAYVVGTTTVSTTTKYTPVENDRNKTLIYNHTASSPGGSVTRSAPSLNLGSTIYATPTTAAEFATAMNNAPSGAIIEIAGGNKGVWKFTSTTPKSRTQNVIVRAKDPANPPVFDGGFLDLTGWEGLTIDGLKFQNTAPDAETTIGPFVFVPRGCKRLKITNCSASEYFGFIACRSGGSDYEFSYNEVRQQRADAFQLYNVTTGIWCHHNKIWDTGINTSWTSSGADRHPDCYQLASTNGATPSSGMIIEDNWSQTTQYISDQGLHGVLALSENVQKDGRDPATYCHKNLTVRRNYFEGVNCEAVGLGGVIGAAIRDNYFIRTPTNTDTSDFQTPQVYVIKTESTNAYHPNWAYATGIDVINNAWPLIGGQTTLNYGPGDPTPSGGGSVSLNKVGNLIAPANKPVGWSGFDAANGKYGPYGKG